MSRSQLAGTIERLQRLVELLPRPECRTTAGIFGGLLDMLLRIRRRCGCRDLSGGSSVRRRSSRPLSREIEHRPTVVREVQLILTVGHVDVVREEEIRTDEHVDVRQIHLSQAQPSIADLLRRRF